jgi:hypothetical protein
VPKGVHVLEPIEFHIESGAETYSLMIVDRQVVTAMGEHPVRHASPDLLNHMVEEFSTHARVEVSDQGVILEPKFLNSYGFFGLQKEWIEPGRDNVTSDFTRELLRDQIWDRLPGPEGVNQLARYGPVQRWFDDLGIRLVDAGYVSIPGVCEGMYGDESTDLFLQSCEVLGGVFQGLDSEQKAVVVFLHNVHGGSLVHALALVSGRCTPAQYAVGTLAGQAVFVAMPDVDDDDLGKQAQGRDIEAKAGLAYIDAYRSGTAMQRLLTILKAKTESGTVEFKSTLRFDLREQRKNRAITDAVIKTIAGFLNTSGGTLVIGVSDDAEPIGIEVDGFGSEDLFLRHLFTSVTNALGPAAAPLIEATPLKQGGKTVVLVECSRGPRPFPAKQKNGTSAFYVRTGPATISLAEDQAAEWQSTHWNEEDRKHDAE